MDAAAALRETIAERLKSHAWKPGQRMPTERALGEQYGLSRSTVRRVLEDFKRKGLIRQTVGSGTYVCDHARDTLAGLSAGAALREVSPAELMVARLALEPALVDLVVGNATEADFARIDDCLRRADAAATLDEFEKWDAALHEAIAEASHNGFVVGVFRLMNEVRHQGEWGALKRRSATPERRLDYQAQHRELVAALKERDATRARKACLDHLAQVRTNMLGY